jgi:hypothetical protein
VSALCIPSCSHIHTRTHTRLAGTSRTTWSSHSWQISPELCIAVRHWRWKTSLKSTGRYHPTWSKIARGGASFGPWTSACTTCLCGPLWLANSASRSSMLAWILPRGHLTLVYSRRQLHPFRTTLARTVVGSVSTLRAQGCVTASSAWCCARTRT